MRRRADAIDFVSILYEDLNAEGAKMVAGTKQKPDRQGGPRTANQATRALPDSRARERATRALPDSRARERATRALPDSRASAWLPEKLVRP